ncbi:MAG: hypothetical protein KIS92_19260 [Planctomycetota bacterium]|nr:hypothetical protein [Planctomycetota bacterium]
MTIGLIAPARHRGAQRLQRALEALEPGCVARLDLDLSSESPTHLDARRASWNGVDLAALRCAVVMGFSYCDPVIPSPGLNQDWTVWRYDYLAEQQTYSYLHSLLLDLARRGVRTFNDPNVHMACFARTALFERLREAGLRVPEMLCTNRLDMVNAFRDGKETVVWRPASGRAIWQLFLDAQRDALVALEKPPILLADTRPGQLTRGYLFEGKPLLLATYRYPDPGPPERLESYMEVACPQAHAALARAAELVQGRWLEVQFVQAGDETWIFDLEADPDLEALPAELQARLTERLAAALTGHPVAEPTPDAEPLERPTMFLRRMLRILFEFEESKYS